jgi:putative RecB family exonuclease
MTATTVPPLPTGETFTGPSLSPSRAADFKTCPLLFRFRTIDKLPEQPTADQARGTLVHAVLEALFDLPAPDRTPAAWSRRPGTGWSPRNPPWPRSSPPPPLPPPSPRR